GRAAGGGARVPGHGAGVRAGPGSGAGLSGTGLRAGDASAVGPRVRAGDAAAPRRAGHPAVGPGGAPDDAAAPRRLTPRPRRCAAPRASTRPFARSTAEAEVDRSGLSPSARPVDLGARAGGAGACPGPDRARSGRWSPSQPVINVISL